MVEETVVWMVPLAQGNSAEHRGMLTLETPNLIFTDPDTERVSVPLAEIRKAKRVRGSPIMVLTIGDGPARREIAFYFAPPPPLKAQPRPLDRPRLTPFGGVRDSDKTTKKIMRTNVSYLHQANASKKAEIEEWLTAIREAMRD
jgi:hypothetical protein